MPEFIDPVFTKTSPKRSFSLNGKLGSVLAGFRENRVYNFGHRRRDVNSSRDGSNSRDSIHSEDPKDVNISGDSNNSRDSSYSKDSNLLIAVRTTRAAGLTAAQKGLEH